MNKSLLPVLAIAALTLNFSLIFSLSGCDGGSAPSARPAAEAGSISDLTRKKKSLAAFSYEYTIEQKHGQTTGKVFKSGKKMRNEANMGNQKVVTISDTDANEIYIYNPGWNTAVKMVFDPKKAKNTLSEYYDDADTAKMKVLETVDYDGVKCIVMLAAPDNQHGETRMWIRKDNGFPARIETATPEGKVVIVHKNIQIGPQPTVLFQLPTEGVKIMDMTKKNKAPKSKHH